MASNENQNVFQCTECQEELNLESKTLPCLHSYCRSCLCRHFEGQTNENCQCPECHEPLILVSSEQESLIARIDSLSLSPFLLKSLRRQQLESTDWNCDLCSGKGIESAARSWCHDCQELYCTNCHKTFEPKHSLRDLDEMKRGELVEMMMTNSTSNLVFDKQWNPSRSNGRITSIYVNKEDDHVFAVDCSNFAIIEFTEWGDFVSECKLIVGRKTFRPFDMCSISPDIFVVCGWPKKLFFFGEKKKSSFVKYKNSNPHRE